MAGILYRRNNVALLRLGEFDNYGIEFKYFKHLYIEGRKMFLINRCHLLLRTLTLFIAFTSPLIASEIKTLDVKVLGNGPTIQLLLEGPIVKGDSQKISQALDTLGFGLTNADGSSKIEISRAVLYFNSPGGDSGEGVAIAKLLATRNIQSMVRKDEVCYSSCAIGFLGGTVLAEEDTKLISRAVELGGVIGFHAPYLDVPSSNYDKQTVDLAYREAVSNIAELIRLTKIVGLSPDVLPEILDVRQDSIGALRTVDDFARFRVASHPVPTIPYVTRSMVTNACRNGYAWAYSSVPGEGQRALSDWAGNEFSSFRINSGYFSGQEIPAVRSIVGTSLGGEGIVMWCIFDHAVVHDKLRTACRGFISAYTLEEAVQRAEKFDKNGEYGTPEVECNLAFSSDALVSFENENTNVIAFVPPFTEIGDADSVLKLFVASERSINPAR